MRISDWSSDVCSSDLLLDIAASPVTLRLRQRRRRAHQCLQPLRACGIGQVVEPILLQRLLNRGDVGLRLLHPGGVSRSEEHTSELQSLMRISYAVFCLKKKKQTHTHK